MNQNSAEQLIADLYQHVLNRLPGDEERRTWVATLLQGTPPETVVRAFFTSSEYVSKNEVRTNFSIGHFHSPVVDPRTVGSYVKRERKLTPAEMPGIRLDLSSMRSTWIEHLQFICSTPFTDEANRSNRYHYIGGPFPFADAITLRMMIKRYRPRRIIEIGSGFSTACMLDSVEHVGLPGLQLTCIEPHPGRLRSLLRPGDEKALRLIEKEVQDVDSSMITALEPNDILFIDSTHVLKTGSDVHYELFHLLPLLKPGVAVHFHDIMYPFEYPDDWIFEHNYSWNEAYALRAFLMYNNNFRVTFWNPLFAQSYRTEIAAEFPTFLRNPGGSIWIERY